MTAFTEHTVDRIVSGGRRLHLAIPPTGKERGKRTGRITHDRHSIEDSLQIGTEGRRAETYGMWIEGRKGREGVSGKYITDRCYRYNESRFDKREENDEQGLGRSYELMGGMKREKNKETRGR